MPESVRVNTLLAIGSAHALYLSFLAIAKKQKQLSDYLLAAFLLCLSGVFFLVFASLEWHIEILQMLLWNFSLLFAPAFYIYTSSLIKVRPRLSMAWLLHFLPYAISFFYLTYLIIVLPESAIDELFTNRNLYSGPFLFSFFSVMELLVIPFYVSLTLYALHKNKKRISNTFSTLEGRNLRWLKNLTISILGIWMIVNGSVLLSSNPDWISDQQSVQYGFTISVFFIFYMGHHAVKQAAIFSDLPKEASTIAKSGASARQISNSKYKKSSLTPYEAKQISNQLIQVMDNDKPFLNNDLTIHDLSASLKVSTHHLSQVLNDLHKQSFFDFLNHYRVEEFKRRIADGHSQQYTLLAVALDSGFNSKSSFNRIFKKVTGSTPKAFVDSFAKNS